LLLINTPLKMKDEKLNTVILTELHRVKIKYAFYSELMIHGP